MDHTALSLALAPVRAALLRAARHDADLVRAQVELAAARTVAEAAAEAARIRAEGRAQGRADAVAALATEKARVGRRTRAIVLRAQREQYDALRSAARPAAAALRDDPDYPRLRLRIIDIIRDMLGMDAGLRDGDSGGVIGEVPGRRLDFSLAGFADRAAEEVAAEVVTEVAADAAAGSLVDGGQR